MQAKSLGQAIGLSSSDEPFFHAQWDAPANVHTLLTTRHGGVSKGVYASLNLGLHVGDHPEHVTKNRRRLQAAVPVPLLYLEQIHGTEVIDAIKHLHTTPVADASFDRSGHVACTVMTADCLPVLLCDTNGTVVAAVHCGWRSLAGGILAKTVTAMGCAPQDILAYFGAAIGEDAFEVGEDVLAAFSGSLKRAEDCFIPIGENKYLANIYALARLSLQQSGVTRTFGGTACTVLERHRFFSYRREHLTGRMVSAIWLEKP